MAQRASDRIDSHEDLCAMRYAGIIAGNEKMQAAIAALNDRLTGYLVKLLGGAVLAVVGLIGVIYSRMAG